jgi:hypothetical protein
MSATSEHKGGQTDLIAISQIVTGFTMAGNPHGGPCSSQQLRGFTQKVSLVVCVFLRRDACHFEPVVIHRNADGEVSFPGRSDEPPEPGYERVELRTLHEVRKFEKHMNRKEYAKWAEYQEAYQQKREEVVANRRREIYACMPSMSPLGRALAKLAMEKTDSAPKPKFEPGFRVKVFSDDNIRPWCDEDTGFRNRRV